MKTQTQTQTKNNDTTLEHIRNAICAYFGISVPAVVSAGKSEYFVIARKMIAWFGNYYGCTDSEIAEIIGRNRTSVIYSRKWVSDRLNVDKHFGKMVRNIQYLIENQGIDAEINDQIDLTQELLDIFENLAFEVIECPTFSEIIYIPKYAQMIENLLGIKSEIIYRELYTFAHRVYRDQQHSSQAYVDRIIRLSEQTN